MAFPSVGRENQRRLHGSSVFEPDLEGEEDFAQCTWGATFAWVLKAGGGGLREGWRGREPDQCHVSRKCKP